MVNLALGIDTGGTLTDGVLFDLDKKKIVAKTKVITTRHDLTVAVNQCLDNILSQGEQVELDRIRMVSLSTTLATNAIVEGQGAEVGLILIGSEPDQGLPTPFYVSVGGGCNLKGKFKEEVDLVAASEAVEEMKDKVDAFAVSGYLSVRNPAQELTVANLIRELTGYPVVCAHQLSSELGFHERTVTAVLNARLMPLITDLIAAVKDSMACRGLNAPLMVVKGDGSLIGEHKARERPIETILSGPAASITGAMALTGIEDGLVIDMGGTTTDLALLRGGRPSIDRRGARVGGWLTQVKAAEITTIGLGGDSFIEVDRNGALSIGPQRVFPLSWVASNNSHLTRELAEIREVDYCLFATLPTTVLVYIKEPLHLKLTDAEREIIDLIRETPHTLHYISKKLNKDFDLLSWWRLVSVGSVHRASITPTDILHVTGAFRRWNCEAAKLGTKILAYRFNAAIDTFSKTVLEEIYFKIASLITGRLIAGQASRAPGMDELASRYFLKEILGQDKGGKAIEFSAKVNLPLIAVGAPVKAYFPETAKRINAALSLPSSAEVANAVGTVSGQIMERVSILIKPGEGGGFIIHAPWGRKAFMEFEEASRYALRKGKAYARGQAAAAGAAGVRLVVEQQDRYSNLARSSGEKVEAGMEHKLFIESVVEISAVGRPWN
ncbi:MAG TPA: hydantoinase/oxoprolinase family protein [Firmicutes bacterium]|nr:hydantoinase/oxoprolinase family protein [Bacillota bacterium]